MGLGCQRLPVLSTVSRLAPTEPRLKPACRCRWMSCRSAVASVAAASWTSLNLYDLRGSCRRSVAGLLFAVLRCCCTAWVKCGEGVEFWWFKGGKTAGSVPLGCLDTSLTGPALLESVPMYSKFPHAHCVGWDPAAPLIGRLVGPSCAATQSCLFGAAGAVHVLAFLTVWASLCSVTPPPV